MYPGPFFVGWRLSKRCLTQNKKRAKFLPARA